MKPLGPSLSQEQPGIGYQGGVEPWVSQVLWLCNWEDKGGLDWVGRRLSLSFKLLEEAPKYEVPGAPCSGRF